MPARPVRAGRAGRGTFSRSIGVAALLIAGGAVLIACSPAAPAVIARRFKAAKIPRIQAAEGAACSTVWLNQIKTLHRAYVSDGDPNTVTIPGSARGLVAQARLHGARLIISPSSQRGR